MGFWLRIDRHGETELGQGFHDDLFIYFCKCLVFKLEIQLLFGVDFLSFSWSWAKFENQLVAVFFNEYHCLMIRSSFCFLGFFFWKTYMIQQL